MSQAFHCGEYPPDWREIATRVKEEAGGQCVRCRHIHAPTLGRTLTVHHFDGNKANCARWNLMALCQACHLSVQARVDPHVPLLTGPPSTWIMPYLVGMYEAGACSAPGPLYDASEWVDEYEKSIGPWPSWAPAKRSRVEVPRG